MVCRRRAKEGQREVVGSALQRSRGAPPCAARVAARDAAPSSQRRFVLCCSSGRPVASGVHINAVHLGALPQAAGAGGGAGWHNNWLEYQVQGEAFPIEGSGAAHGTLLLVPERSLLPAAACARCCWLPWLPLTGGNGGREACLEVMLPTPAPDTQSPRSVQVPAPAWALPTWRPGSGCCAGCSCGCSTAVGGRCRDGCYGAGQAGGRVQGWVEHRVRWRHTVRAACWWASRRAIVAALRQASRLPPTILVMVSCREWQKREGWGGGDTAACVRHRQWRAAGGRGGVRLRCVCRHACRGGAAARWLPAWAGSTGQPGSRRSSPGGTPGWS